MLRNLLIVFALTLALSGFSACGEQDSNKKPAKKSADIVKDYVETVVTAPEKARDAGSLVEAQQNKTEEMLRQLEE
jgi:hypothetical protein